MANQSSQIDGFASMQKNKNPIKVSSVDPYRFMREADNGTGGFLFGHYLTKHTRERDYEERRNSSFYLNFTKRVIKALSNPIFREEPVRTVNESQNEIFQKFLEDCDNAGNSFNKMMKKACRKTQRYGVYFCVVENLKESDLPKNRSETINQRKMPYIYFISPEKRVSHSWNNNGTLASITFKETAEYNGKTVEAFRKWEKSGWELYFMDGNAKVSIDSGVLSLSSVPVVPIYSDEPDEDEDPVMLLPPLYHMARTNLGVYEITSELRELERNQMFSILTYPKKGGNEIKSAVVGTKNALTYDADSSHAPAFISPDAAIHAQVMESRRFLIEQLFEMAALSGISKITAKQESGVKKEWDFQATREALGDFKLNLEAAEKKIVSLFFEYLLVKDHQFKVNYSDNFGIIDDQAVNERAETELGLPMPGKVKKQIKTEWVRTRFRDSTQDVIDDLVKAVEEELDDEIHSNEQDKDQDGV